MFASVFYIMGHVSSHAGGLCDLHTINVTYNGQIHLSENVLNLKSQSNATYKRVIYQLTNLDILSYRS
jgi:hypothetical protein